MYTKKELDLLTSALSVVENKNDIIHFLLKYHLLGYNISFMVGKKKIVYARAVLKDHNVIMGV